MTWVIGWSFGIEVIRPVVWSCGPNGRAGRLGLGPRL